MTACGRRFDMYDVVAEATGLVPDPSLHNHVGTCNLPAGHAGTCVVLAARWMFERVNRQMRWSVACAATVCGVPSEVSLAFAEGHPGVVMQVEISEGQDPARNIVVKMSAKAVLELMTGLSLWPRDALEQMAREESRK